MTQDAEGDGARRRLRLWSPRAAADDAADSGPLGREALAGSQDVTALLDEIDALRLGLAADLGLVASALDAEVPEIARDVLAGAQQDLARFALRTELRLRDAADAEAGALAATPPPVRPRRARRLALFAPALTAAAALVGLLAGVVPSTGHGVPERSIATSAAASYAELYRLHELGAPAARLARAARQLHAEVARLVAVADDDPAATRQALRLLELQVRVLQDPQHAGALAPELAESRRLLDVLRSAALRSTAQALLADLPAPTAPDDVRLPTSPAAPATESGPTTAAVPAPPAAAPAPGPTRAAAEPQPAPAPAAPPAERPAPQASPEPAEEPSSTTSPTPDDPSTWFPTHGTGPVLPR